MLIISLSIAPAPCIGMILRLFASRPVPDRHEASWRSGYAEDCKSLHPGSIPGEASKINHISSSVDLGGARRFDRAGLRRSSLTTSERRQRRTIGRSCDRIKKPSGTIQKPRIGKNPSKPPIIRPEPNVTRTGARAGRQIILCPTRISPRAALKLKAFFFAIQTRTCREFRLLALPTRWVFLPRLAR